jgi:hypothetical protein
MILQQLPDCARRAAVLLSRRPPRAPAGPGDRRRGNGLLRSTMIAPGTVGGIASAASLPVSFLLITALTVIIPDGAHNGVVWSGAWLVRARPAITAFRASSHDRRAGGQYRRTSNLIPKWPHG